MHDIPFNIAVTSTAPTDANTTTIVNTVDDFGRGAFRTRGIQRLELSVEHDQAATLRIAQSTNHGTNWDQARADIAIAAPAAGTITEVSIDVAGFPDVRVQWVNGGVTQGTWRPSLRAMFDREPGA